LSYGEASPSALAQSFGEFHRNSRPAIEAAKQAEAVASVIAIHRRRRVIKNSEMRNRQDVLFMFLYGENTTFWHIWDVNDQYFVHIWSLCMV
jgi:hypothetical protein